jgi:PKD repeat protein
MALLPLLCVCGSARAADIFGQNLVVNGDAESSAGAPDDNTVDPPADWIVTGNFTAIVYGATSSSGAFPAGGPGKNFFAGGPDCASSSATQTIDVSSAATQIDSGAVSYTLSALLGGYETQGDNAVITATFLDGDGYSVGGAFIGPVSAGDRSNATCLLSRSAYGTVPAGARSVSILITMTRLNGYYNDGYADNVVFELSAQTNTPPKITSGPTASPQTVTANAPVAFAVAATDPNNFTLNYIWDFGDGTAGSGAAPEHSYAATGTFQVNVTVDDGQGDTAQGSVMVTVVSAATTISTDVSASTSSPGVGETVTFSAGAIDFGGYALTYAWDFGDNTTGAGANPTHAYAVAGSYTATLTVTDSVGNSTTASIDVTVNAPIVGTGVDTNGNGVSDSFEAATGFNPSQPITVADVQNLSVLKMSIKLNFAKPGNDAISMSGTLQIPAGIALNNQEVYLDIGGAMLSFTLNEKGVSPKGNNLFAVSVKSKKGAIGAQTAKYAVKLMKGSFATALAANGLGQTTTSKPASTSVTLPAVTVIFNNTVLQANVPLTYKATNKTGSAQMAKPAK